MRNKGLKAAQKLWRLREIQEILRGGILTTIRRRT